MRSLMPGRNSTSCSCGQCDSRSTWYASSTNHQEYDYRPASSLPREGARRIEDDSERRGGGQDSRASASARGDVLLAQLIGRRTWHPCVADKHLIAHAWHRTAILSCHNPTITQQIPSRPGTFDCPPPTRPPTRRSSLARGRIKRFDRKWGIGVVIQRHVKIGIFARCITGARAAQRYSLDTFERGEPRRNPLAYCIYPHGVIFEIGHERSLVAPQPE